MKVGDNVRLKMPAPPQGVVLRRKFNEASDSMECLIQWEENGETVARFFSESELELVPPAPAPAAPADEGATQ